MRSAPPGVIIPAMTGLRMALTPSGMVRMLREKSPLIHCRNPSPPAVTSTI